jgi:hypothetical protein
VHRRPALCCSDTWGRDSHWFSLLGGWTFTNHLNVQHGIPMFYQYTSFLNHSQVGWRPRKFMA